MSSPKAVAGTAVEEVVVGKDTGAGGGCTSARYYASTDKAAEHEAVTAGDERGGAIAKWGNLV